MKKYEEKKVLQYYKTLKELHGKSVTPAQAVGIISDLMKKDTKEVEAVIYAPSVLSDDYRYALINMRAQPVHFGHEHIINEALLDGRIPLIVLGRDGGKNPSKNPLTFHQRRELIQLIFPNVRIEFMYTFDDDDWTKWFNQYLLIMKNKDVVFYYNNKEADRYKEFICHGKIYKDTFYTDIFKDFNIPMKQIEFAGRTDIHIDADATNIRDSFCQFKHLLDARVYWKLVEWGWGPCSDT